MNIGFFFVLLGILLFVALPVGGVFALLSAAPNLLNSHFTFGISDVARAMFSGLNSFTLLAVPMFMVSGMIMAQGGISKKLLAISLATRRLGSPVRWWQPACSTQPFPGLLLRRFLPLGP